MDIMVSTMEERETRPWANLPFDILFLIFQKIGVFEVLLAAQAVCTSWRQLARDPRLWRCIDMRLKPSNLNDCLIERLICRAVDHSDGYIEEFYAEGFVWDYTFSYITNRTNGLRKFGVFSSRGFTENALKEFVSRCPLLEEVEIHDYLPHQKVYCIFSSVCLELKRFRLNRNLITCGDGGTSTEYLHVYYDADSNSEARHIANSLPKLRELQLIGSPMNNEGLHAILDNCVHLESLDIRGCSNVDVDAGLKEKLDKINIVRLGSNLVWTTYLPSGPSLTSAYGSPSRRSWDYESSSSSSESWGYGPPNYERWNYPYVD